MHKHLFFICPTDQLEPIIHAQFKHENYYCTSIGNSVAFDTDTIQTISNLIATKEIQEVTFVLSDSNRIFLDALSNQDFVGVGDLSKFYDEITSLERRLQLIFQENRSHLLSYFLYRKMNDLTSKISDWPIDQIKVNGKIYNSKRNTFSQIPADLLRISNVFLN